MLINSKRCTTAALRRVAVTGILMFSVPALSAQQIWGINGHPDNQEYEVWLDNGSAVKKQFDLLNELGSNYYRVSFSESRNNPAILDRLVPLATNRSKKIQIVPIVFVQPIPSAGYQSNYDAGYAHGKKWADYALEKGYRITHWELGNETSLTSINGRRLFKMCDARLFDPVHCKGLNAEEWSDAEEFPGATEAMAGVLRGLHWGIHDAYKAHGSTTSVLFGDTWTHFGYIRKIMSVGGANFFPGDVLSWHWYTPSFNGPRGFTMPLVPGDVTTRPSAYAASFGKDIWMTEVGREIKVKTSASDYLPVGGSADNPYNGNENWSYQARQLQSQLEELMTVPQVKAIFVYELYDENITFSNASVAEKSSQAFFGLLNAYPSQQRKTAFYTYRDFIGSHP
jgi:hypothetical protein